MPSWCANEPGRPGSLGFSAGQRSYASNDLELAGKYRCACGLGTARWVTVATMPRGGGLNKPYTYSQSNQTKPGEAWLGVGLRPDAPPEALLVHDIAKRLKKNVDTKLNKSRTLNSIEDLAEEIDGISHQTIRNIIQGRTWPDLSTIARLERYFNRKLWGNAHKKPRP